MKVHNHTKRIAQMLATLFVSYLLMISCFTHTHVVNGVTIVHSHPYAFWKKNTDKGLIGAKDKQASQNKSSAHHTHSKEAIVLIDLISHFVSAELPSIWTVEVPVICTVPVSYVDIQVPTHAVDPPFTGGLRGPPLAV